jgi:CRP-like cAMP-binding protein
VSAWLSSRVRRPRPAWWQRKDDPPAVLVGPDPEEQTDQRAGQDRGADQQAELGIVQAQLGLDLIPMIAKIVQTAKQIVKAKVLNGRDTTLTIVEPVRSFILAAVVTDMPYLMTARTLSASRILLMPAELVRGLIHQDKALMMAVIRELANGYREFVRTLADLKLRQSTERIGNYLLLQSRRRGGAENFQLPGEKKMLASLLGMTPENLSRGFGALVAEGVEVHGSQVTIRDRERLEAFSRPDAFYDPVENRDVNACKVGASISLGKPGRPIPG